MQSSAFCRDWCRDSGTSLIFRKAGRWLGSIVMVSRMGEGFDAFWAAGPNARRVASAEGQTDDH